jgi:hypothetical protein
VREESHLDDMRAAIRGDFERLARRRGSQELMHEPAEPQPPAEPEPPTEPKPPTEPEPQTQPELMPEPEHLPAVRASEDEAPPEEPIADEGPPRRGFFARLLGL